MPTTQLATKYEVEPAVLTAISAFLQDQVRYGSLAFQAIPEEQSLSPIQQAYEWHKKDFNIGIGFESDVVSPPDAEGSLERKELATPILFSNYGFTYDQWRKVSGSRYGLQERLMDQIGELRVRADLITYIGDTKYSIDALGTAIPGTEITTQINVSSLSNIATTFAAAFKQLRSALKYNGLITEMSSVVIECTPDIMQVLEGALDTNQTGKNGRIFLEDILKSKFKGPNSQLRENPYLDGSYSVNSAGVHTITEGTDSLLMYVQDPRVMKLVTSGMEIRTGNLDQTKGQTVQPVQRLTRNDVEPLGVLVETDVAVA